MYETTPTHKAYQESREASRVEQAAPAQPPTPKSVEASTGRGGRGFEGERAAPHNAHRHLVHLKSLRGSQCQEPRMHNVTGTLSLLFRTTSHVSGIATRREGVTYHARCLSLPQESGMLRANLQRAASWSLTIQGRRWRCCQLAASASAHSDRERRAERRATRARLCAASARPASLGRRPSGPGLRSHPFAARD